MATLAQVVPMNTTPIALGDVVGRLGSVYVDSYGAMFPKELLAGLSAIIAFETAGGSRIQNGNVGNVTVPNGVSPTGMVWEANGLQFIAFDTIAEGMAYWLEFMRRRYPQVMLDCALGDTDAAVRDLFRLGYLGTATTAAQEAAYAKGVRRYYAQTLPMAERVSSYYAHPYIGASVAGASVAVLGLLGFFAHRGAFSG